jgi:hypothetical protein
MGRPLALKIAVTVSMLPKDIAPKACMEEWKSSVSN